MRPPPGHWGSRRPVRLRAVGATPGTGARGSRTNPERPQEGRPGPCGRHPARRGWIGLGAACRRRLPARKGGSGVTGHLRMVTSHVVDVVLLLLLVLVLLHQGDAKPPHRLDGAAG